MSVVESTRNLLGIEPRCKQHEAANEVPAEETLLIAAGIALAVGISLKCYFPSDVVEFVSLTLFSVLSVLTFAHHVLFLEYECCCSDVVARDYCA